MKKAEFYVTIVRLKIFAVVNASLTNTRFETKDLYDAHAVLTGIAEVMGSISIKPEFFMLSFQLC